MAGKPVSTPRTTRDEQPSASTFEDGTRWDVKLDDGTIRKEVVSGDTWALVDEELGKVSAEDLNNVVLVNQYADGGKGSFDDPYRNACYNAISEAVGRGTYYIPPGVYEEDQEVSQYSSQFVWGSGAGIPNPDYPLRGVVIQPSSSFSDTTLWTIKQGTGGGGIEYPGLCNVTLHGDIDNHDIIILEVRSVRMAWVDSCKFTNGGPTYNAAVSINGRMVNFSRNEIVQNESDFALRIGGSNARSQWIHQNNIVNTRGGIRIKGDVDGRVNISQNRLRNMNYAYLRVNSYTGSDNQASIRFIENNLLYPGSTFTDLGPDIEMIDLDAGGGTHPGPIRIQDNNIFGWRTDGTKYDDKAVVTGLTDVTNGLHFRGNDIRGFDEGSISGEVVDLSGVTGDATFGDNTGQGLFENSGQASVSDGDTIAHGLAATPNIENSRVDTSSSNRAYISSVDGTNLTVALEDPSGTSVGTDETVFWSASV